MRLRLAAALGAALVLVMACGASTDNPSPAANADWPMFRGDFARDGHPPGATLNAEQATHFKQGWKGAADGPIDGSPVVVGNTVIVATGTGWLYAFDLSGKFLWKGGGGTVGKFSGSPAVAGDLVVVGALNGRVFAFHLSTGKFAWVYIPDGVQPAVWSSPAIFGQIVVVGVGSQYGDVPLEAGKIVGLELATGRRTWNLCVEPGCATGGGVWSSVAIDGSGQGFVGTGNPNDSVLSFDTRNGRALWETRLHPDAGRDLDVGATPVILTVGGKEAVAVGSDGGLFDLLDANTGRVIWSRFLVRGSAGHGLIASPAYDGTNLYVPSASDPTGIFALNPATGAIRWQRLTDLPVYSAPAVGARALVFGTGDGFGDGSTGGVMALSTTDGAVLWKVDLHSSVFGGPAIVGTTVFVGSVDGSLYAFRPG